MSESAASTQPLLLCLICQLATRMHCRICPPPQPALGRSPTTLLPCLRPCTLPSSCRSQRFREQRIAEAADAERLKADLFGTPGCDWATVRGLACAAGFLAGVPGLHRPARANALLLDLGSPETQVNAEAAADAVARTGAPPCLPARLPAACRRTLAPLQLLDSTSLPSGHPPARLNPQSATCRVRSASGSRLRRSSWARQGGGACSTKGLPACFQPLQQAALPALVLPALPASLAPPPPRCLLRRRARCWRGRRGPTPWVSSSTTVGWMGTRGREEAGACVVDRQARKAWAAACALAALHPPLDCSLSLQTHATTCPTAPSTCRWRPWTCRRVGG